MKEKSFIGVDIGGTKIGIGKISNNKLIQDITLDTQADESTDEIINDIISGIKKLVDKSVVGIGIGVPGLIDEENGIVYGAQNIPSWKEVPLKLHIEDHFNIKVSVSNDANCFALGEKIYGKGKKYRNMAGLVLGTGLGAGLILDNQIYGGTFSAAGEFGGISYLRHDYEYYCSGKYFINNHNKTGEELYKLACKGNIEAIEIFKIFGKHVGNVIKAILYAIGPQAVILGGSVSESFVFFKEAMWKSVSEFPHKRITEHLVIERSNLEKAGILGAAALVLRNRNLISVEAIEYEKH